MLADKFKSAKTIDVEKQIKAYVNKNYGKYYCHLS